MRIGIVGCGLIGAAAGRHLAEAGHEVLLIGPDEPADKSRHAGPFGSHYDEGRIADTLDSDTFWVRACRATISRLRDLEHRSGETIFTACGSLAAGPAGGKILNVEASADAEQVACQKLTAVELAERFPYFRFAKDDVGLYEAQGAGHLNPRALIRAQLALAGAAGADIVRDTVRAIETHPAGVGLAADGATHAVDRVLVAAGCFTNDLLDAPVPIEVYARTVTFYEIADADAARLAGMPTLLYERPTGREPYLLPPIRYPDGRLWLKLGGDPVDVILPDAAAVNAWFRSDGSAEVAAGLEAHMQSRMPDLAILSTRRQACAVTFTRQDRPFIARVGERVAVATAGCARGAMTSDELGRRGALAVLGLPADGG